MEIREENGLRILYAEEGKILQSVTDGLIIGPWLILGKKDSEIHYHEIDEEVNEDLPVVSRKHFWKKEEEESE